MEKREVGKLVLLRAGMATTSEEGRGRLCPLPEDRIQRILNKVVSVYAKNFSEVTEGRAYLESRRIDDAGVYSQHNIGYCAGRINEILPQSGVVREELKAAGILLDNGQERFNGCVVVPVYDVDGRITNLYGRSTKDSPTEHVFLPGRPMGLWNIGIIKTYPEIIIVKSVIFALSVEMCGLPNVIAAPGYDEVTDDDLKMLKENGVEHLILLSNSDKEGKQEAQRLKDRIKRNFSISCTIKTLPEGHTPNSYLVKCGAEQLGEWLVTKEENLKSKKEIEAISSKSGRALGCNGEITVTYGLRRYQIIGLERKARKLQASVRIEFVGKLHVDTLDFYSAKSRRMLVQDICRIFEQAPETIESDITRLIVACEKYQAEEGKPEAGITTMTAKDRAEVEGFGRREDLIEQIIKDFETCGLIGEASNKLLGYVAMTSRKREEPLSVMILSSSGAGKTALQDTVCLLCPPEELQKLTNLSGKALFYKDQLSLKHKVLALEEGEGAEEANYAIRNLISARELVSESTIKDLATGRLTTMANRVEGPAAVFLTTTNPEVDAETKSRFFVTSIDESKEQTRRILLFQRQRHLSGGPANNEEINAVVNRHRNFQRLLKNIAVKNPYAAQLTYGDERLQSRRDQPKYLNLIKAVAFLRQMSKTVKYEMHGKDKVPFIEVDLNDIEIANKLAHEVLGRSLDELSPQSRDLLIQLDEMVENIFIECQKQDSESALIRTQIKFTRRDIRKHIGWSNTRLHIYLKELVEFEYVLVESGRNGLPYLYRLAYEGQGKNGERFMLGLKDIQELAG